MTLKLALAGDTMLGRGVAERLRREPPEALFAPDLVEAAHEADLFVANLECCISERGDPWPAPSKPFFFRGPPSAAEALALLGVDCVTLANNHALDYGADALVDTFDHLAAAGIRWVGAGPTAATAHARVVLETRDGFRLAVVGVADHPSDYAAAEGRPGIAYADLRHDLPEWLLETIRSSDADALLVTPHWGPNMTTRPSRPIRAVASAFLGVGATLVAGHSAHVFHGVEGSVLYDLGDFLDDYARDLLLRNDLGLLWFVTLDRAGIREIEALPLKLDYCHTEIASGDDAAWVRRRLTRACLPFGTTVRRRGRRLTISTADAMAPTPSAAEDEHV